MVRIDGLHYETLLPIRLQIDGTRIASLDPLDVDADTVKQLPLIAPGLFDIQVNGYNGTWFASEELTTDKVVEVTQALVSRGIAKYFPTLITASFDALEHGFRTLRKACESCDLVRECVAGFHLEGPYLSAEDGPRGAHPVQHIRPADFAEFSKLQAASGDRIRLITVAPESPGAAPFIEACRKSGVVVSIGHTAANSDQIQQAVTAGAQLSTHFGNGAHAMLPRHPNYLWDQLACPSLSASVIADGWHLPPAVLKCVLACKSKEGVILTCDASGFAGCRPGQYDEGDVSVEVLADGRVVVAGQRQYLAGSGVTTGDCVVHMAEVCGISIADSVRMATINPCCLMDMRCWLPEPGGEATLTVFRTESAEKSPGLRFVPESTFVNGYKFSDSGRV